ncbi:1,4-alpha-glucan branching protein GlgB [Clostridiales bacterium FE2011]|nr:1,4-alpha-glucan branching protein GlgB [Clostridiales bacterium FE2011]QTE75755.1 1,4-alpha-glucan branching protein GlgB [Clostridiales bacterium FE2010]
MWYNPPDGQRRESFHMGNCVDAYDFLGAHPVEENGELKWHFSVWAPNAQRVSLVGEFCGWDREAYPMEKQYDGIWELRLPDGLFNPNRDPEKYSSPEAAELLRTYKYAILCANGEWHMRADPYGFEMELRPSNGSKLRNLAEYQWNDSAWMEARKEKEPCRLPMNIYEMHLGTWRRGEGGRILNYAEIADQLVPYLQDMGYTHVEFMPVMEHPFDGSWGYQVIGYYAATSRYGTPDQLRYLIDKLHQAGIAVILDWVPAHFPKDEAGLRLFDGTPCYEHADSRRAEMPQWGTLLFDYARGEAVSFLTSNALFWLKEYHVDGLRFDAVSCMLYLDFGKESGQWVPNQYGGHENLDAVRFLQNLNKAVEKECPGAITVAEESTAYPKVTHPVEDGGLGFNFKWNMGWMNDILSYIALDPIYRQYHHDKITFSMMYAFSENYVLPFSHDEVVHCKGSMLDKHPGDLWKKFAGLRALYGYYMVHPGKKLLFMGGEFGQFVEWRDNQQLDWFLLDYEKHPDLQEFVKALNHLYSSEPAMHKIDDSWDGFKWLNVNDKERSVAAVMRSDGEDGYIACAVNFTPQPYLKYRIGLPFDCELTEILNSDREEFGGSNLYNGTVLHAEEIPQEEHPFSCEIVLPPLAAVFFRVQKKEK